MAKYPASAPAARPQGAPDGTGQLAEFNNREDLERWLKDRPREDVVVIAARAALRVLPLLVTALDEDAKAHRATIVMPTFRAMAAPWVTAVGPTQGAEVRTAAAFAATAAVRAANAFAGGAATAAAVARAAAVAARAAAYAPDAARAAADAARTAANVAAFAAGATDFAAAAAAANANAAANADDALWRTLRTEMAALENDTNVAGWELWPDGSPYWFEESWRDLKAHLLATNEGWEVWTDWYEDRLHDRRFNKALEEARVLMHDEIWEHGPNVVNAQIAWLIKEHSVESSANLSASATLSIDAEVITLSDRLDAALTSVELRAALADFKLDDLARLMRMVPFVEDIKHLDDPLLEKDRANKLSELVDAMAHLATDIRHDAGNAPGWLRRDLGRYSKEAALGPEAVRPGHLWDIGAGLAGALKDEDIEWSLGIHLFGKLERLVEKHLDLMRDYFAATLARTRPLDQIETAPDATPDAMIDALDQAVAGLDSGDWGDAPPPDPEIPAVMADRVEELRGILDRINRTTDERKRGDLERTFWRKGKAAAMTVMRYGVRSMELTAVGYGVVAGTQTHFPATFQAAVNMIRELLPYIPRPF